MVTYGLSWANVSIRTGHKGPIRGADLPVSQEATWSQRFAGAFKALAERGQNNVSGIYKPPGRLGAPKTLTKRLHFAGWESFGTVV